MELHFEGVSWPVTGQTQKYFFYDCARPDYAPRWQGLEMNHASGDGGEFGGTNVNGLSVLYDTSFWIFNYAEYLKRYEGCSGAWFDSCEVTCTNCEGFTEGIVDVTSEPDSFLLEITSFSDATGKSF